MVFNCCIFSCLLCILNVGLNQLIGLSKEYYKIAFTQSRVDTQSMTFLGETSSQTIVNSRLTFIFPNGSIIHNDIGVYFQTSTPVPIRVPNSCDFVSLKTRIHNTLQLSDK